MANQQKIFDDIKEERKYQDGNANDWAAYINTYVGNAVTMPTGSAEYRKMMIKVAALTVAALEMHDDGLIPKRHYE